LESTPFFIPSTSLCSLSSWLTSSYVYHLITVITFTPDLKRISFTNPFLHSHSYSFRTDFTDVNLYCIKGALALFVLVFFWLRVLDKAEYSAFESTLNSAIVSYRIVRAFSIRTQVRSFICELPTHQCSYRVHEKCLKTQAVTDRGLTQAKNIARSTRGKEHHSTECRLSEACVKHEAQ